MPARVGLGWDAQVCKNGYRIPPGGILLGGGSYFWTYSPYGGYAPNRQLILDNVVSALLTVHPGGRWTSAFGADTTNHFNSTPYTGPLAWGSPIAAEPLTKARLDIAFLNNVNQLTGSTDAEKCQKVIDYLGEGGVVVMETGVRFASDLSVLFAHMGVAIDTPQAWEWSTPQGTPSAIFGNLAGLGMPTGASVSFKLSGSPAGGSVALCPFDGLNSEAGQVFNIFAYKTN